MAQRNRSRKGVQWNKNVRDVNTEDHKDKLRSPPPPRHVTDEDQSDDSETHDIVKTSKSKSATQTVRADILKVDHDLESKMEPDENKGCRTATTLSDSWGRLIDSIGEDLIPTPLPLDTARSGDHLQRVNRIIFGGSSKTFKPPHHLNELGEDRPESASSDIFQNDGHLLSLSKAPKIETDAALQSGSESELAFTKDSPRKEKAQKDVKKMKRVSFHKEGPFVQIRELGPRGIQEPEKQTDTRRRRRDSLEKRPSRESTRDREIQTATPPVDAAVQTSARLNQRPVPNQRSSQINKQRHSEYQKPPTPVPSTHMGDRRGGTKRVGTSAPVSQTPHLLDESSDKYEDLLGTHVTDKDRSSKSVQNTSGPPVNTYTTDNDRPPLTNGTDNRHYSDKGFRPGFKSTDVTEYKQKGPPLVNRGGHQSESDPGSEAMDTREKGREDRDFNGIPGEEISHVYADPHASDIDPYSRKGVGGRGGGGYSTSAYQGGQTTKAYPGGRTDTAYPSKNSEPTHTAKNQESTYPGKKTDKAYPGEFSAAVYPTVSDNGYNERHPYHNHDHPKSNPPANGAHYSIAKREPHSDERNFASVERRLDFDSEKQMSWIQSRFDIGSEGETASMRQRLDTDKEDKYSSAQRRLDLTLSGQIKPPLRRGEEPDESETNPDLAQSQTVPDDRVRKPLSTAGGEYREYNSRTKYMHDVSLGGNITEQFHNNNTQSLSPVATRALPGTNEGAFSHATAEGIKRSARERRHEKVNALFTSERELDYDSCQPDNLPSSSGQRGRQLVLSKGGDRDSSHSSSALRKELPLSSTERRNKDGQQDRRGGGVAATVEREHVERSYQGRSREIHDRQGTIEDRHEPQNPHRETGGGSRIAANKEARARRRNSLNGATVTFQEDSSEEEISKSVIDTFPEKNRRGGQLTRAVGPEQGSFQEGDRKRKRSNQALAQALQEAKERNRLPADTTMARSKHRHYLRPDDDLNWDYSPDECRRLSPSPRHKDSPRYKDRESTSPHSKFVKDGSQTGHNRRKEYLEDGEDIASSNQSRWKPASSGFGSTKLNEDKERNSNDRRTQTGPNNIGQNSKTPSQDARDEDTDELRKSLRELSAKIQLKRLEEEGVFNSRRKQKDNSHLPQQRLSQAQSSEQSRGSRNNTRSDDSPNANERMLRDRDSGIAEEYDDELVSLLDEVDIEENYNGGDTYVFYLQTDQGDLVGPLRFDVEDIQMGLPTDDNGLRNRQTGSHGLNEFSSRSHSVLTVTIDSETQPDTEDENLYVTKRGKLSFVDLAGSEKVKDSSGSFGGPGMLESNSINKSLLVLGNCISHLGDAKRRQGHIPYRDSKLTKLLSDSLGGNGITLMIACITPSSANITETMNTLRYASRAKKIKTKPTVKMDPREKLILSLKREIKVLRNENHYLRQQLEFPAKPKGQLQKENDEKFMKFMKEQKEKESGLYEMLQEYMVENENLRAENSEMHSMRDRIRREQQLLYRENERLMKRLEEMEKVVSTNPAMWAMAQPKRTDGYGQYDLVSPRGSPVAPGYQSGHSQKGHPPLGGSPPGSRGKGNPPGPMRPPHRLPDPVMRPAQRPIEMMENGATYPQNNGYTSPRAGGRQTSPTRQMERKASQISNADAIHSMNEQLKREVMQLEGQIRHHQYVQERSQDLSRPAHGNGVR